MTEDEVAAALGELRQRVIKLGEPFRSTVVRWLEAGGVSFDQAWTSLLIFVLAAAQVVGEWVETALYDLIAGRENRKSH